MKKLSPKDHYVYQIKVDGIVRYVGKGKGLRMYSHMKEVRERLNRDFKLDRVWPLLQRNLTEAVMKGAEVTEEVLTEGLTEKASYELEHKLFKEFVFDGKREQLWNVIPSSIYTPEELNAYILKLKGNLNHRDKWIRYCSGHTLDMISKEPTRPKVRKTLDDWFKKQQSDLFKQYMKRQAASEGISEERWYKKYLREGGKIYGKEGFMEAYGLTDSE